MDIEEYVVLAVGALVLIAIVIIVILKMPRKLKREFYVARWKHLQQRCPDKNQWAQAIIEADDLLADALKKKRFKGKNVGERLVEAQKNFTNNDAVWFGHKLRTRIDANPAATLSKQDVQKALVGFRQALKDLGAL